MTTEMLPFKAAGWRLVVEPAQVPTKTAGGIELPEDTKASLEYLRHVGQVVDMGPLCYRSDDRFKLTDSQGNARFEPHCEVGDWVVFAKHGGHGFTATVDGEVRAFKILNDDEILMVVNDPSCLINKF